MRKVLQKIIDMATASIEQPLNQEPEEAQSEEWDPDASIQETRQFTRRLGHQYLQIWAEVKTQQAQVQDRFLTCGQRPGLHQQ